MSEDSSIPLRKFVYRKEGDYYIIWHENSSDYIELDETSFNILNQLSQGITPEKISEEFKEKHGEYPDLEEFIEALQRYGFIGDQPVQKPKGSLSFIKPYHTKWLYSKPALLFYTILIIAGMIIILYKPEYYPEYSDYFIFENYLTTILAIFTLGIALLSIHELSHLLSGRSIGINGRIGFGLRLYFPVAETNLTGLWSVERKQRHLPILAGMLSDLILFSLGIMLMYSYNQGLLVYSWTFYRVIRGGVLILFYSILWQFMLFIKTDLYYFLSNLLGVRNLYEESWSLIEMYLKKALGRQVNIIQSFPEKDRKIIIVYSIISLILSVYSVCSFTRYGIPIIYKILRDSAVTLFQPQINPRLIAEAIVSIFFTSIQLASFLYFSIKIIIKVLLG